MPDPIRTSLILPPALLDDEHTAEAKADGHIAGETSVAGCAPEAAGGGSAGMPTLAPSAAIGPSAPSLPPADSASAVTAAAVASNAGARPGAPLKWDPYGRDGFRKPCSWGRIEAKHASWSVEPLAGYLKDVARQIDSNLRNECLPTAARLDAFVSELVTITQKQLKHAPKKERDTLKTLISGRFQKFWDYKRNQKVRPTTPEELKSTLVTLVEMFAEFAGNADALRLAQPKPVHYHCCSQLLRNGTETGGG